MANHVRGNPGAARIVLPPEQEVVYGNKRQQRDGGGKGARQVQWAIQTTF
jgi:hypothetical protein